VREVLLESVTSVHHAEELASNAQTFSDNSRVAVLKSVQQEVSQLFGILDELAASSMLAALEKNSEDLQALEGGLVVILVLN